MSHTATEGHRPPERSAADRRVDGLLVRVAQGDQKSFAGVYDALVVPVMGMAGRILRDEAQAEEVTQDVMIEVWRTAARFRPERGAAKSWVLTLAHRRAVERVRSVQASTDRERRAAQLYHQTPFDEVVEAVEEREQRARVYRCLAGLGNMQRLPLVLAYYQGLTYAEVAEALSTPPGTVKTRMRTGLQKLRACLGSG
ncbi:ECF RNA polymerase sigma factor SigK [Streptomyces decoyicus]|uniref:ECF RNA polymerase sigma factor SigK n=1 Tax=Streptomyces decoyicus TaxID=249567 RepID=UPI00069E2F24|nr:ECF RNA polymerase sigma factor SigK [Streptomyces decoyicus]KOG41037.1 RNA polymerase sigma factor SigK [Streptomyces decoyicus]QZY19919.1 ECF RNA polymerase sigma factor SigK [Streptomyces decoyicus]